MNCPKCGNDDYYAGFSMRAGEGECVNVLCSLFNAEAAKKHESYRPTEEPQPYSTGNIHCDKPGYTTTIRLADDEPEEDEDTQPAVSSEVSEALKELLRDYNDGGPITRLITHALRDYARVLHGSGVEKDRAEEKRLARRALKETCEWLAHSARAKAAQQRTSTPGMNVSVIRSVYNRPGEAHLLVSTFDFHTMYGPGADGPQPFPGSTAVGSGPKASPSTCAPKDCSQSESEPEGAFSPEMAAKILGTTGAGYPSTLQTIGPLYREPLLRPPSSDLWSLYVDERQEGLLDGATLANAQTTNEGASSKPTTCLALRAELRETCHTPEQPDQFRHKSRNAGRTCYSRKSTEQPETGRLGWPYGAFAKAQTSSPFE